MDSKVTASWRGFSLVLGLLLSLSCGDPGEVEHASPEELCAEFGVLWGECVSEMRCETRDDPAKRAQCERTKTWALQEDIGGSQPEGCPISQQIIAVACLKELRPEDNCICNTP